MEQKYPKCNKTKKHIGGLCAEIMINGPVLSGEDKNFR